MTSLSENEKLLKINHIMQRTFGKLMEWERPILSHEFGENNLPDVSVFEKTLTDTKGLVFEELKDFTDQKIVQVEAEFSDPSYIGEFKWCSVYDQNIRKLLNSIPFEIQFGFGHPKFVVDFDYWSKMGRLSIYEVTALSVGANPEIINEDKINGLNEAKGKGQELRDAYKFLLRQYEIFSRHFRNTGWGYYPKSINSLKELIDQIELEVHPEFYSAIARRVAPKEIPNKRQEQRKMTNQERETLLKLIAAMSCEQYGYDPKNERSEVARSILDDIEQIGSTMDAKTIRKWLKEASVLVDPEYWTKET